MAILPTYISGVLFEEFEYDLGSTARSEQVATRSEALDLKPLRVRLARLKMLAARTDAEKILTKEKMSRSSMIFRAKMRKENQPRPGLETVLVDRLIAYEWRMRRIPYLEAAILNDRFDEITDMPVAFGT